MEGKDEQDGGINEGDGRKDFGGRKIIRGTKEERQRRKEESREGGREDRSERDNREYETRSMVSRGRCKNQARSWASICLREIG